jgi:hypothetical protein
MFWKIFAYVMAVIYLVAGITLLVHGWYVLTQFQNIGLGIILIIYSVFRGYRIYVAESPVRISNRNTKD